MGSTLAMLILLDGSAVRARAPELDAAPIDCSAPRDVAQKAACADYERMILDATIQLQMIARCSERPEAAYWQFDSHATVLNEHTLLTHDHYRILTDRRCELAAFRLYTAEGKSIGGVTDEARLADVVSQLGTERNNCRLETCTLVLDWIRFTSVQTLRLAHTDSTKLADQVGQWPAIAQVNWQGILGSTSVQWTRPRGSRTREGVPVLEVADDILAGASGGGAFMPTAEGLAYIGNSWSTRVDGLGSEIALNP
jgi:hypothetical protein